MEGERNENAEGQRRGVNRGPARHLGRSQPGTEGGHAVPQQNCPPPNHTHRHTYTPNPTEAWRGQLSYVGLTASVYCVLGVCLDSTALLSQQLNSRWLKKASIQRRLDQKNQSKESTQAADKTHKSAPAVHTQTLMQMTWGISVANIAN